MGLLSGKVDAKCEQVKVVRVPPNAAKVPLTGGHCHFLSVGKIAAVQAFIKYYVPGAILVWLLLDG